MAEQVQPSGTGPETIAQRAADELALALEDVGFDVGREFPLLAGAVAGDGTPIVELGHVSDAVSGRLSAVMTWAAEHGASGEGTLPPTPSGGVELG